MRHHHRLRRDIAQDQLKDRACLVMQQGDMPFQVDVPVCIAAQDNQLYTSKVGIRRRDDTVVARIAWVGGEGETLWQAGTSRCRQDERPGWHREEGSASTPEIILELEGSARQLHSFSPLFTSPGRRVCSCHAVWLPI